MNNLPKVVTQLLPGYDLNPRPVDCKSNALPIAPPRHLIDIAVTSTASVPHSVCFHNKLIISHTASLGLGFGLWEQGSFCSPVLLLYVFRKKKSRQ